MSGCVRKQRKGNTVYSQPFPFIQSKTPAYERALPILGWIIPSHLTGPRKFLADWQRFVPMATM